MPISAPRLLAVSAAACLVAAAIGTVALGRARPDVSEDGQPATAGQQ